MKSKYTPEELSRGKDMQDELLKLGDFLHKEFPHKMNYSGTVELTVVDIAIDLLKKAYDGLSLRDAYEKTIVPKAEPKVEYFGTFNPRESHWAKLVEMIEKGEVRIPRLVERYWDEEEKLWVFKSENYFNYTPGHFHSTIKKQNSMKKITTIKDIDGSTPEGRLLLAALEYLTTPKRLNEIADRMDQMNRNQDSCMSPRPEFSQLVEESFDKDKANRKERLRKLSDASGTVLKEADGILPRGVQNDLSQTLVAVFRGVAEKTRIPSL